jgi:cobalt/nickel transport system ATP-binding protein
VNQAGQVIAATRPEYAPLSELRQRVAPVFQDPDDQLFAGTVRQDVSFGPMNLGLDEPEVCRRVDET